VDLLGDEVAEQRPGIAKIGDRCCWSSQVSITSSAMRTPTRRFEPDAIATTSAGSHGHWTAARKSPAFVDAPGGNERLAA